MRENAERAAERDDFQARGPAARALLFFGAAVAIAIVFVTGYEISSLRHAALEQSRHELGGIGVALAEHAERVVGATDAVMRDVARQFGARREIEGATAQRLLRAHAAGLPVLAALAYTDAEGRVLAHSVGEHVPAVSLADREDFQALRAAPGGLYVGRPFVGRIVPRLQIDLSRAIADAGGRFRGIVTAGLDVDYFAEFFRDVAAADGAAAVLFRTDGTPLAQYPPGTGDAPDWRRLVAGLAPSAKAGSFRFVARDGKARLIGYRRVDDQPLLVLTSVDEEAMLSSWRASTLRLATTAVFGIALVWALVGVILRRMRSEALQALRLAQSEEQFRAIVERASDALLLYDLDGRIVMVNQMACACLGYTCTELTGSDIGRIVVDSDRSRWLQLAMDQAATYEVECRRKDGSVFPAEARLSAFAMGERRLILAMARDISERKAYQARLEQQANFDLLTGLPNRLLFLDRLQTALAAARRNARQLALLFIDLDGFKKINDTLGHAAGDTLLVEAGRRIGGVLREADTAARYGGDEFVVLLPEVENGTDAERVADKIHEAFLVPANLSGRPVLVRPSVGVALYPADGCDADDLLRYADADMYLAKGNGRRNKAMH